MTAKLKKDDNLCHLCDKEAIVYLKDLKTISKNKKLMMCELHFNVFCRSLIENDIPYGKPTPTSTKR